MEFSKNAFRALGLCLVAAFGLLAFVASAAQAEPGAQWMVNGKNLVKPLLPQIQGEIEVLPKTTEKHLVLLTEVGKSKVEILCEKIEIDDGLLHEGPTATATSLLFFGCITKLNGATSTPCEPKGGEIHTEAVIALLKLHKLESGEIDDLVLIAPEAGTTFVKIHFASPTCAIELEEQTGMPITGEAWVKDCNKLFLEEEVIHLIEEVKTTLGHLIFGTAGHEANIDGSVNLFLVGEHKGQTWSGLWK